MEAHEASEMIEEAEGSSGKNRTALTISILAMVLAVAGLGGSNTGKNFTQENVLAATRHSFYQAKSIRQTLLKKRCATTPCAKTRGSTMPKARCKSPSCCCRCPSWPGYRCCFGWAPLWARWVRCRR